MSCSVGHRHGSDPALLCSSLTPSLGTFICYRCSPKKKKKKKKKKREKKGKKESRDWNRYLYTNVKSKSQMFFHNSQRWKQLKCPLMDEQISKMWYIYIYLYLSACLSIYLSIYSGTLFSLKKEGHSDTCYDMDEPWGHFAKWNKPNTHTWKGNYFMTPVYTFLCSRDVLTKLAQDSSHLNICLGT